MSGLDGHNIEAAYQLGTARALALTSSLRFDARAESDLMKLGGQTTTDDH